MNLARVGVFYLGSMFLTTCTFAQGNNTFTQVGTWSCTVPAAGHGSPLGSYACPAVTFPQTFGGTPSIVGTACSTYQGPGGGGGCGNLTLQGASPTGFTPLAICCGARGNTVYSGSWTAVGPLLFSGTGVAKYIVLTVLYAPPGTNGGHSSSSVTYGAGSSTGTTTSASQSFKQTNTLTYEAGGGFLGTGGSAGLSFGWSNSTTDSQSLDIKKSTNSTISRNGPSQDGINHDEDAIYLLLQPTIDFAVAPSSASWILENTTSPIQVVYVGWLNGHSQMPSSIASALASAGITAEDYPEILSRDPLASSSPSAYPSRFVSVNTTFPYEPPYAATDPVPTITTTITDASTQTTINETDDTYTVGLTLTQSVGFLNFAKSDLKDTSSWEWTNKSSLSSSAGTSQTASFTVGGPAFGYTGPTVLLVYVDAIYHTFAFDIVPANLQEASVTGTILKTGAIPAPFTEVTLDTNGIRHSTFTNAKGQYTFWGHLTGPGIISVAGTTQNAAGTLQIVPQVQSPRSVNLTIP